MTFLLPFDNKIFPVDKIFFFVYSICSFTRVTLKNKKEKEKEEEMTKRRAVLIILSIALVALVGSVTDYFLSLPPVQPEVDSGFRTEDLPLVAEVVCLLGGRQISPCGDGATVEILFHFECPDVSSVVARAFVISGESMRWIQKVEVHQESDLCSARMLLGRLWIGHSTVLNIGVFLRVPGNGIDRALRFYGRPDNQAIEIAWRGSEAT